MTHETYDWQAALSDDLAHAMAHGAECALTDAASNPDGMSPGDHALVGIGFALLAVRAQVAQTGGDVADQLSAMADDVRDLTDAVVSDSAAAARRPWWRRLADRLSDRVHRPGEVAVAVEACPDGEGLDDADVAAPGAVAAGATVTPLRRTGADDVRR
ncbi:hypothetical protein [Actinomadura sp. 3N407]|uniref:hypothetical protein n=1 Tax=Actinomadura sp. 3N407 TaxID=3457423 RepID=UPI003FCE05AD